jgi:hypothetical protein
MLRALLLAVMALCVVGTTISKSEAKAELKDAKKEQVGGSGGPLT